MKLLLHYCAITLTFVKALIRPDGFHFVQQYKTRKYAIKLLLYFPESMHLMQL